MQNSKSRCQKTKNSSLKRYIILNLTFILITDVFVRSAQGRNLPVFYPIYSLRCSAVVALVNWPDEKLLKPNPVQCTKCTSFFCSYFVAHARTQKQHTLKCMDQSGSKFFNFQQEFPWIFINKWIWYFLAIFVPLMYHNQKWHHYIMYILQDTNNLRFLLSVLILLNVLVWNFQENS